MMMKEFLQGFGTLFGNASSTANYVIGRGKVSFQDIEDSISMFQGGISRRVSDVDAIVESIDSSDRHIKRELEGLSEHIMDRAKFVDSEVQRSEKPLNAEQGTKVACFYMRCMAENYRAVRNDYFFDNGLPLDGKAAKLWGQGQSQFVADVQNLVEAIEPVQRQAFRNKFEYCFGNDWPPESKELILQIADEKIGRVSMESVPA